MFTLHDTILRRAGGFFLPLCLALGFCAITAMDARAQTPPNDNLTNAQAIVGSSGIVYGDNLNATAEAGEPAPYPGTPAQASIWYLWTAPISTTMDFSTRYSTDPNGNELGTVMAVYTLPAGAPLAFANLTQIVSNEYDPSAGVTNGLVTSRVDFPVTVGHEYLIQIDGSTNTPNGSNDQGYVELNWSPSLVGGNFTFSADLNSVILPGNGPVNAPTMAYFAGELDDSVAGCTGWAIDASLHNPENTNNIRITVSRQGGFTGKCQVTMYLTNGYYTNLLSTNYVGTNIYITNYDTNGVVLSYTNIFFTNIATENQIQDLVNDPNNPGYPKFTRVPVYGLTTVWQTNANGVVFPPTITPYSSLASLPIQTNFEDNFPCERQGSISIATNGSIVTVTQTQPFCTDFGNYTMSVIPSATNTVDYAALTTNVVFNDFQMSRDVYVQINPKNTSLLGPDYPDTNGNFNFLAVNPYLVLVLTNAALDPNEDPDITPPTITAAGSSALLGILTFYGNPFFYDQVTSGYLTSTPLQCATINLERATFRVNRAGLSGSVPSTNNVELFVVLAGNATSTATYSVNYAIDTGSAEGFFGTGVTPFQLDTFPTVAGADYAEPAHNGQANPDFGDPLDSFPVNCNGNYDLSSWGGSYGTVNIGPASAGKEPYGQIAIPIYNYGAAEFDEDLLIQLFFQGTTDPNLGFTVPGVIGNMASANMTINAPGNVLSGGTFNQNEPGGAYDVTYNPTATYNSSPPFNPTPGANPPPLDGGVVQAVAMQPNGQAIIGGFFTSYDTTPVYGIARLLTNGWLDTSFNNVAIGGVDGSVSAIVIDTNNRIIIGGDFTSYDGNIVPTPNIARLTPSGALDTSFSTGLGFNSSVYALAIDANGNILVGGDFTSYNTTNCNHIARLLPNGALDTTFLPDTGNGLANFGTDQDVLAVATDANGNVILGGEFSYVNGSNMNYLARLLPGGALDPSFIPDVGPDGPVNSLAIETNNNNEIIIGGAFQDYNLASSPGVALITYNGALDTTFPVGAGADGPVYSVVLQPNNEVLVGGQFRNFNTTRRLGIARLLTNGWVDTSFMDTSYNQFAGLINSYYNQAVEPVHTAYALAVQPDGNIIVGGSFTNIGGGPARDSINVQVNVTRLIGSSTPGPMTGGGGNGNAPGNITLTKNAYTANDTSGKCYITFDRVNGSLGPAQVTLGTNTLSPGPGSATAKDFGLILSMATPFYDITVRHMIYTQLGEYGWKQSDGMWGNNILPSSANGVQPFSDDGDSSCNLNIYNDLAATQNLFANLSLLNVTELNMITNTNACPLTLGGVVIPTYPALGTPSAPLEIINNNFPVGFVGFSATNYTTLNTSNSITITVERTNGSAGSVSVTYYTANGTALAGSNYTAIPLSSNKTLHFSGNSATFSVPILDTSTLQSNKFFKLFLTNANPTSIFDTNIPPILSYTSMVTIVDGNFTPGHLSFTSPTYSVLKPGTATIGVERLGGATGQLTVQVGTSNGTAINGVNYTGFTNTLSWNNQDVSVKTVGVQTLQDNTVDGPLTVNVNMFNATNIGSTNNDPLILYSPTNATLTILDSDSYGNLNFAAPVNAGIPNFNILQNAGQALITVIRTGGTTGTLMVNYSTSNYNNPPQGFSTAQAGTNYGGTNGTLVFGSGVTSQSFVVPVYYTPAETTAANRMVALFLTGGSPTNIAGQFPKMATLTIVDPQLVYSPAGSVDQTTLNGTGFNGYVNSLGFQPDGSILAGGDFTFFNQYPFEYVARLNTDGAFDSTFLFDQAGANSDIYQALSQTTNRTQINNGPIVVAGSFTSVDAVTRNGLARLNIDGSVDETFNPGAGADSTIFALAETTLPTGVPNQTNVAFYIGGSFANYNGSPAGGIARVNGSSYSPGYQGALDPNFVVGQGVTSGSGTVRALAVQSDNSIIVGGDFTSFNSEPYYHLVRLNSAGVVDATFNVGTGSNAVNSVNAIVVQPDGRILVGGSFTNVTVSNVTYNLNYLARLNANGSVDTSFNVGVGGNNSVLALAVDSQERIVVGGEFTRFSGVTRSGITRLNPDGTVDPTINFQGGADGGFVDTIAIQANDEIDVGGGFTSFEGISENNFVRLYGGANTGNGDIQFSQPVFGVLQSGTNAVVTLQRLGGEGASNEPPVTIVFSTSDGSAVAGSNYTAVTTNVTFPPGETFESVLIPINNSYLVSSNLTLNLNLSNPTNTVIGPQASAILIITNSNTAVEFSAPTYRDTANAGSAVIPVVRLGDSNTTVSVTVYTGTNGTATPYVDYTPESVTLTFNPGITTRDFNVPLLNATNMFSDQTVQLELSNSVNASLASPSNATLTIANIYTSPGVLSFAQPSYAVSEGATNAVITVYRTNGSSGSVSVTLTTSNGTAIAGTNYGSVDATINFADGVTNQSVDIPVYQLTNAGADTTVLLNLSNPLGGTSIGGANPEILTILNDIENFSFAQPTYSVLEGGVLSVYVVRGGSSTNTATVNYYTYSPPNASESNGQAVPNVDYIPTSGTLTYASNVTQQSIPVQIPQGNVVNGPLNFQVILNDPTANSSTPFQVQIAYPGTNTVTILSDLTAFEFSTNSYYVGENGSNLVVTVYRINTTNPAASVQFGTSDGTNQNPAFNAVHQVDYVATNGVLNFTNGQISNSFTVPILNPNMVENSKTFNLSLSNALVNSTAAYLGTPSNATVTITNVLAAVSLGSPTYAISECLASEVLVPIVLSGTTNQPVSVRFGTANGTAIAGVSYFATNGTVNFAPGQTTTNVAIQIINNHISGPSLTLSITLSNATNAQLLSPTNAVVTIQECNGFTNFTVSPFASSAFFSWNTLNPAMVQVAYGLTTNYGSISSLAGPTTNAVVLLSGLARDTTYYYNAMAWEDGTLYTTNGSFATVDTLILNTINASFSGSWSTGSSSIGGYYGNYFNVASTTPYNPSASATYSPSITVPGYYNVYTWYPQYTNFSLNAQMFVSGATSEIIDSVNQTTNGATWQPLASSLDMAAGSGGNVIVYNDTGETNRLVAANAMKWSYVTNQDYTPGVVPIWWSNWWSSYLGGSATISAANYSEYILGTAPNGPSNATNFWAVFPAKNTIKAYFTPYQGGRIYRLQSATNLTSAHWLTMTNLPSITTNAFTNASGVFTNTGYGVFTTSFSNATQTYFRLYAQPSTNY